MLDLDGIERVFEERKIKRNEKMINMEDYDNSLCHLLPSNRFGVAHIITA